MMRNGISKISISMRRKIVAEFLPGAKYADNDDDMQCADTLLFSLSHSLSHFVVLNEADYKYRARKIYVRTCKQSPNIRL